VRQRQPAPAGLALLREQRIGSVHDRLTARGLILGVEHQGLGAGRRGLRGEFGQIRHVVRLRHGADLIERGGKRRVDHLLLEGKDALSGFHFRQTAHALHAVLARFHTVADAGPVLVLRLFVIIGTDLGAPGLGFGRGRQKYLYLPEEHNDYIFAIACEELGFVGAIGILILFALLIIRGYWIAMHARDRFSMLLAAGLTTLLALQVFLNVAVVTNLLPSTGISLPFFSYGGTALIMHLKKRFILIPRYKISLSAVISFFTCLLTELSGWNTLR